MDAQLLNRNSLYRKMLSMNKKTHCSYLRVSQAIDGERGTLTKEEATLLISIINESVKDAIKNIQSSIFK